MQFCNPCVRPANSSIIIHNQRPTNSIKSLLRRQLFKKSSIPSSIRSPISRPVHNHSHTNTRFQRVKGSTIIREVHPGSECSFKTDISNNYDMTVLHDDQLDDTQVISSRRKFKSIPRWARKSQLQLAFINQIYFNDKNPEAIFGPIQLDLVHQMVQSIESQQAEPFLLYSSSLCPPNFV